MSEIEQYKAAIEQHGSIRAAARALGVSDSRIRRRLNGTPEMSERRAARAGAVISDGESNIAQLQTELRTLRAALAQRARDELDEEFVKAKIFKLSSSVTEPPAWLVPKQFAKGAPGVPTLFASDWHWAEVVDPRQIGGVNEYNLEIAHARARRMVLTAIDLLNNHMVNPKYPGIVFPLGGDMVSGDIHEELMATNEAEIMPTVIDLFGVLIWCITTLANHFGRVFVPCVSGNHGRNTHKIRAKGRNYTSFDWLLYCFLAKHFEGDKRVSFLIPNGSDALYRIYGHRYLLTHGDQFRGGDGMIGALGPIIRGDHKKRSRQTQIGESYDTMLLGHWHQWIQLPRLIVNGSLKGYDEYAYANNFPFELPRQALWVTHPLHGITFSMPVNVDEPKQKTESAWVSWNAA
ncbi:hypothetical protein [Burkholderia cenocepacia]|uniref:hypothetical protein n=1 Tax=Burkholderia cenocepacia TaxID=95486 RepID=UPI0006C4EE30|nr:hypothetical protein [Burkholderia cenocepacia]KOR22940.1 hypothetical protein ABW54_03840 [Burkholderia cenocepacia]